MNFDQDTLRTGVDLEHHDGLPVRELERVLKKVHQHRRKDLPVGLDFQSGVNRQHAQADAHDAAFQRCGRDELVDELGEEEPLRILDDPG